MFGTAETKYSCICTRKSLFHRARSNRFEEDSTVDWKAAPLLGEDNRYVFLELLGFTEGELLHYVERGVIG